MMLWPILLVSCATYRYAIQYEAAPAEAVNVAADFTPRLSCIGDLVIQNNGAERVYLVWNDLTVVNADGVQGRVYKGSQTKLMAEMSLPDEPIDPGAKIQEAAAISGFGRVTYEKRPATWVDATSIVTIGISSLVENSVWRPGAKDEQRNVPGWNAESYTIRIPIRSAGATTTVDLKVTPVRVDARKALPPDPALPDPEKCPV